MSKDKQKGLPEDYFKNFQNNLENKINQMEDDLEKDAVLLHSLKGKKEYRVPQGYFDELRIPSSIKPAKKSYSRTISLFTSVAAAIALLVVSFQLMPTTQNEIALNNIEDQVLYDYLLENVSELDDDALSSY